MMAMGGQRRSVNRRLEIERTRSEKKKKSGQRRRKKRRSESLHIFFLCILEDNKNIKSGSVCNELSL